MRVKSKSWSIIISFLTGKCSDGDRLMGKTSLHRIATRLWCYLPFSNVDSAYPLANSSVASFITTTLRVYLNPNSILQIVVFVHLCEAFLGVPPKFPMFKSYFLLKYQPSADKWKVIGCVGLQTRPRSSFLDLQIKTSLKGWHKS
jgi:hypothetical protein